MNRLELDFLHNSQETAAKYITAKSNFAKGMRWEENKFYDILPVKIELINNSAADHLVRAVRHLRLPGIPEIALLSAKEKVGSKSNDSKGEIIYANADMDIEYPNGLISISPDFIQSSVINAIRQEGDWSVLYLGVLLAHESFHLWQHLKMHEELERDLTIYVDSGLDAWNKTESEIQAREFGKVWAFDWFKY